MAGGPEALGVGGWGKEGRTASRDRWSPALQDRGVSALLSLRADKPGLLSLSRELSHSHPSRGCPGLLTLALLTFLFSSVQSYSFYQDASNRRPHYVFTMPEQGRLQTQGIAPCHLGLGPAGTRAPFSQQEGLPACSASASKLSWAPVSSRQAAGVPSQLRQTAGATNQTSWHQAARALPRRQGGLRMRALSPEHLPARPRPTPLSVGLRTMGSRHPLF